MGFDEERDGGNIEELIREDPPSTLNVEVLQSAAGYYIGQLDEDGCPYSRLSWYYPSFNDAADSLEEGFMLRQAPENIHVIKQLVEEGVLKIRGGVAFFFK